MLPGNVALPHQAGLARSDCSHGQGLALVRLKPSGWQYQKGGHPEMDKPKVAWGQAPVNAGRWTWGAPFPGPL
ncbi:hypothetical protein Hsc_0899 [Herbaspirillum seropedicae]|nr:hypothetical protein Hsc_0899 [Herbaspirillum seropedicae]